MRKTLSQAERRILGLLARGDTYETIGVKLFLSPSSVAYHANKLQARFKVPNNTALVAFAFVTGLLLPGVWPPEVADAIGDVAP